MILKVFTMLFNYIFVICFLEATFNMVLKMLNEILLKIPSCVIGHWSMFKVPSLIKCNKNAPFFLLLTACFWYDFSGSRQLFFRVKISTVESLKRVAKRVFKIAQRTQIRWLWLFSNEDQNIVKKPSTHTERTYLVLWVSKNMYNIVTQSL